MAKNVYWKDFDNEMNRANSGDVVTMTNIDAISNSLTNIFLTFQGSRRMLPTFALPIYRLLFEPIDPQTAGLIADHILNAIEIWEPRIIVKGLDIKAEHDKNQYTVTINYSIVSASAQAELRTFTQILRAR